MVYLGDCVNECSKSLTCNNLINTYEYDYPLVNIELLYCINATILSYDMNSTSNYIKDLDLTYCITRSKHDIDIYDGMIFVNLDPSKTIILTNVNMYSIDFYNKYHHVWYKNCKLTSTSNVDIKHKEKEFEVSTSSLMSSKHFYVKYSFTLYQYAGKDNYISVEYFVSGHILQINFTHENININIFSYVNGKKELLYTSIIKVITALQSNLSIKLERDFDSSKLNILINENSSKIFEYDDVLIPISISRSFSKLKVSGKLNNEKPTITTDSTFDSLDIFFPKIKKKIRSIVDFNVESADNSFKNNVLYFNCWSDFDYDLEKSFSSSRYVTYGFSKEVNRLDWLFGNYFERNTYNRLLTEFICDAEVICIDGIHLYDKSQYDEQILSFQDVVDSDINGHFKRLTVDSSIEYPLLITYFGNLSVNKCFGIKLRFTRLGQESINNLLTSSEKLSINKIGISYSYNNYNYINPSMIPQDETGSTIVPAEYINISDITSLEIYNHTKNRYIHISGKLSSLKNAINPALPDEIFITSFFIIFKINGKFYSASSEGLGKTIKMNTNNVVDLLLTIMY